MNKHESQQRNHKIMRLRGIIGAFPRIIPQDIRAKLQPDTIPQLLAAMKDLKKVLDDSTQVKVLCDLCAAKTDLTKINDRKQHSYWSCDQCGCHTNLHRYKQNKKEQQ